MNTFRKINTISGWITFLIAVTVYIITVEPTVSLWDCGEFIATSYKLQIGHPPGAPFYMLLARFFSLFAGSNLALVAKMINYLSAIASAFTILFLFWTITHILKNIFISGKYELTNTNIIVIIGSGLVGSLAYTFSDTFWFSAVEAEVYALSSLFTAIVFWAILKWEDEFDNEKNANRWIVLIAFLMGISIGVHLLNLLAIPAIVLIYYFKKYPFSWKGLLSAFFISTIILAFVMYGFIQGFVRLGSYVELFFVNSLGFAYNTGFIIYVIICIGLIIYGIVYANQKQKYWLQMLTISLAMLLIGYSSYAAIMIRASANPPINENNPSNIFALLSYIDREQYGDRPLIRGPYFNAPIVDIKEGKPRYAAINGKYEIIGYDYVVKYDKRFITWFPRMYSSDPSHIKVYKSWAEIKGKPVEIIENGQKRIEYVPTFFENLKFFFSYQIGHMYMRYLLWNFVGRQNDQEGGGISNGNWISGINIIDEKLIGNTRFMPEDMKQNPSRNTYYFLPFILGLIGLLFLLDRSLKYSLTTILLFFFTGLAIVLYLNQTPLQPRERDYAYAGSFYVFAIWIGLGVTALIEMIKHQPSRLWRSIVTVILCLLFVPVLMAKENWNDHDRSKRFLTRSLAYNYLQSCAPNAILFTYGDNDTFPLWYLQEVEGIRTDVRVVNTMLLNSDWYIDQMKRKVYQSDPLPISLNKSQYLEGKRSRIYLINQIKEPINVFDAINFIASDDPRTKTIPNYDEWIDYLPGRTLSLPVNVKNAISAGIIDSSDLPKVENNIVFELKANSITKSQLIMLDIIANNQWKKPIYFASNYSDGNLWLNQYLQLDGYVYQLVPIKTSCSNQFNCGRIKVNILYKNIIENFDYTSFNNNNVYIDNFQRRSLEIVGFRNIFTRLAAELLVAGKKDSTAFVLQKCIQLFPFHKMPYDYHTLQIIDLFAKSGEPDTANHILAEFSEFIQKRLVYYFSLDIPHRRLCEQDIQTYLFYLKELIEIGKRNQLPASEKALGIYKAFQKV